MWYIGIDLHSGSFTVCVLDSSGNVLFRRRWETSGRALIAAVSAVGLPNVVVIEESCMAGWAYGLLTRHGFKVVVADPLQNHLISSDGNIDDGKAAQRLAELLRGGFIKQVHHTADQERNTFKQSVLLYHQITRQLTRAKNQAKGKFRSNGVRCIASDVFKPKSREHWLAMLPDRGIRQQATFLLEHVDFLESQKRMAYQHMRSLSVAFPEIKRFQKVPGIGMVRACTFYALVDTPHRFETRGRLWAYCGIGIARAQSDEFQGPEHLNRNGNRLLKEVLKGAAISAITVKGCRYAQQYEAYVQRHGKPELALLNVSRSLCCTMWMMWRTGQPYDPAHPKVARPAAPAASQRATTRRGSRGRGQQRQRQTTPLSGTA